MQIVTLHCFNIYHGYRAGIDRNNSRPHDLHEISFGLLASKKTLTVERWPIRIDSEKRLEMAIKYNEIYQIFQIFASF